MRKEVFIFALFIRKIAVQRVKVSSQHTSIFRVSLYLAEYSNFSLRLYNPDACIANIIELNAFCGRKARK